MHHVTQKNTYLQAVDIWESFLIIKTIKKPPVKDISQRDCSNSDKSFAKYLWVR